MVEELLFGFGGGCNRMKGGVVLDRVDAGQLPRKLYFSTSLTKRNKSRVPSGLDCVASSWLLC